MRVDDVFALQIIPSMIYLGSDPCPVGHSVSESTDVDIPPALVWTVACGKDLGYPIISLLSEVLIADMSRRQPSCRIS